MSVQIRILLSTFALSLCVACRPTSLQREAAASSGTTLPGMPPVILASNIYSEAAAGKLSATVRDFPERIYVPNSGGASVDVIDPKTFRVIDHFRVGRQPQHVTPSYDLKSLWVLNDLGDSLTRIDPKTGEKRETIPVKDPYNMYYTPDGKYAIVVAEREKRLNFYDAQSMKFAHSLSVPCRGVDHMDFTTDGRQLIASCEFSGELIKVDVESRRVLEILKLPAGNGAKGIRRGTRVHQGGGRMPVENDRMPQDVKTSPDGKLIYVADMMADGVHIVRIEPFKVVGFLPTGRGAHGLYPSRDARLLYCSNRDEGTVSVIDFATQKVVQT
jgi:DNA-binding beta-propeller fold protein YncE